MLNVKTCSIEDYLKHWSVQIQVKGFNIDDFVKEYIKYIKVFPKLHYLIMHDYTKEEKDLKLFVGLDTQPQDIFLNYMKMVTGDKLKSEQIAIFEGAYGNVYKSYTLSPIKDYLRMADYLFSNNQIMAVELIDKLVKFNPSLSEIKEYFGYEHNPDSEYEKLKFFENVYYYDQNEDKYKLFRFANPLLFVNKNPFLVNVYYEARQAQSAYYFLDEVYKQMQTKKEK